MIRPALFLPALALSASVLAQGGPALPTLVNNLTAGTRLVKIVGFGDSITGVYYHTGGRRAWPEMLGIALQRVCPLAKIEVINAGVSGGNTVSGLARMDKDVLAHQPDLVVIMFGMNDVAGISPEAYEANLRTMIQKCREVKSEVVLCTPNWIAPDNGARDLAKLMAYADIVRKVGKELSVPVADTFAAYAAVHGRDQRVWTLLMSDGIHPNMRGHKLFAEVMAETITGKRPTLEDVAPIPGLPHVKAKLEAGQPLRVIAMPPYDTLIEPALKALYPQAQVQIVPWDTAGQTVAQIEKTSQEQGWMGLQSKPDLPRPGLVIFAPPPAATAPAFESFYRSYTWVLNWSLSFGVAEWDAFAVLPGVAQPHLDAADQERAQWALEVVTGQDIQYLTRPPGEQRQAAVLLREYLQEQLGK
jgi:lysophospholipase L1-like esterase